MDDRANTKNRWRNEQPKNLAYKMKQVKKINLPFKLCETCNKEYTWRKKWKKNWEEVKYCSEKCKRNKKQKANAYSSSSIPTTN